MSRLPQNSTDKPMCDRTDDLMFNYQLDGMKQSEVLHTIEMKNYTIDMSTEIVRSEQQKDEILKNLFKTADLLEEIVIKEGIMYLRDENKLLLLVPDSLKNEVLETYHNHPLGGHLSKAKLFPQLKERFYWEGMQKDVLNHTRNCPDCLKVKTRAHPNQGLLRPIVVTRPFQLVGVDIAILRQSSNSYRYILVTVDYFTNWVEAIPMKNQTAEECTRAFYSSVISKHGSVEEIMSDSGTQFLSGAFNKMCRHFNIKQRQSSPYSHQANGKVEKFICFLKAALSLLTPLDKKHTWDEMIDHCLFVYRTSYNRMINDTPFFLLHGRDALLPQDVAFGVNIDNLRKISKTNKGEYQKELMTTLRKAYEDLIDHRALEQNKYKRYYDKTHKEVHFNVGDKVLILYDTPAKGALMPRWEGPFIIIERIDTVIYRLENDDKITTAHVQRMVKIN